MPGAAAVWGSAVSRARKNPSRRPKSRTYTNNSDAQMRLGGATNGAGVAFNTVRGRSWSVPGGLR